MDIKTIADLLKEFVSAETEVLNNHENKHPTTIGTMYEGLTADVLNSSIFVGLNLQVVKNSFIKGCPKEFDILLVDGEGDRIPHTDRYTFKPEQVIVIISVKKNLYSKDLEDGYDNLKAIVDHYDNTPLENYMVRLYRMAFRSIFKKELLSLKVDELTETEEMVLNVLKLESFMPVRMIWGYNGFVSEFSLRESFCAFLSTKATTDVNKKVGWVGPHNFPNLIICGQYSMFKLNGMPYGLPIEEGNWWPFYASSSYNPVNFFLEAIWTRLSFKYKQLPTSIFGEDLAMEPTNRFLDCRRQELQGFVGWEYNYRKLSDAALKANIEVGEWSPVELDKTQFIIINILCSKGEIDLSTDKNLEEFIIKESSTSLADFLEKLKATGLVFIEKNKIKLLTDECQCLILPNGKSIAGENKSGRLTSWIMKHGHDK